MEIINTKSLHILTILGSFYLLMSYLGSLCTLMDCSGIEYTPEEIYGATWLKHLVRESHFKTIKSPCSCWGFFKTSKTRNSPKVHKDSWKEGVEILLDNVASQSMSAKIHLEQSNAFYILDEKHKEIMNELLSQSCTKKILVP